MNRLIIFSLILIFTLIASDLSINQQIKADLKTIIIPDDFPTIGAAISNASDGDTLFVKRGSYKERITITKALSIIGEDKETTIINGGNTGTIVLVCHDNVTFTGFTVIYDSSSYTPQSIWMWSTRLAGIHLLSAKNCNISNNIISNCGAGLWLYDSHKNILLNNNVSNNDYGIRIEYSTNNTLSNNMINKNWGGIRMISTSGNRLSENKLADNIQNFGISNNNLVLNADQVDLTNTLNNNPICYWIGVSNTNIPLNAAYVVLINCTNITIQNLNLSNNQEGIILAGTLNTTITNNVISGCTTGILLFNSFLDKIIDNTFKCGSGIIANGTGTQILRNDISSTNIGVEVGGNFQTIAENSIKINQSQGYMLKISGCFNNITKNFLIGTSYAYAIIEGPENIFYNNILKDSYGLRVSSDKNIISKNNVTGGSISISGLNNTICINRINNGFGLTVAGHNNRYFANQVQDNTIGANTGGLESYSSNNWIFQNNFIANKNQIKNYENKGNFWDNGTIGNYWSDYNGTDINTDGIGDQPYFIMGLELTDHSLVPIVTGQDSFPLIAPIDISNIDVELPQWKLNFTFPSPPPSPTMTPTETDLPIPSQTIPTQSPISPTPSPTIPEFSTWIISSLIVTSIMIIMYTKKKI